MVPSVVAHVAQEIHSYLGGILHPTVKFRVRLLAPAQHRGEAHRKVRQRNRPTRTGTLNDAAKNLDSQAAYLRLASPSVILKKQEAIKTHSVAVQKHDIVLAVRIDVPDKLHERGTVLHAIAFNNHNALLGDTRRQCKLLLE